MSKLGPNSPCHCGSGRKYKKCCKRADAVVLVANRPPQSGHVAAGPTRSLQGTSLDKTHPTHAAFDSLIGLDIAAGQVFVAWRDLKRPELALSAAKLDAAIDMCRGVSDGWAQPSTPFGAACTGAARAAHVLAENSDPEASHDLVEEYVSALEVLNGHIVALTSDVLADLGLEYTVVPDFGVYWYSNARLSIREGYPYLVVELTVRLYPTHSASGGLFTGRASLWGLSQVEFDGGLRALLAHDGESDLDPKFCLIEILHEIADLVELHGAKVLGT